MPAVNPNILRWARETAGFDLATASRKLSLSESKESSAEDKLRSYEVGEKTPSRTLLLKMSKQYRRPLLAFYLHEPPRTGSRGEDFRTLSHSVDPSQEALVDALIRNVKARQEIVKDSLVAAQDRDPIEFIGTYRIDQGTQGLVERIRDSLNLDLVEYRKSRTQDDAFKYLRDSVERLGVFTLLLGNLGSYHTNLSTEVFRGFALSDNIAPFIVVNDQDAKSAWSVTLLHELVHLWLGTSGISGARLERAVEKFCDKVASELLLPETELTNQFRFSSLSTREGAIEAIDSFATERKVSSRFITFRLLQINAINQTQFDDFGIYFFKRWKDERNKQKIKARAAEGGPSYYLLKRHQVGAALLETSERLLQSGELSTTRAATVLGVRALKIEKMFTENNPE